MKDINGNIQGIKSLIDQAEIQNAKQNMNSVASKNMILGAELTSNISNTASLGNINNSVPNLNNSTSVGSGELQNVKNNVQKSGNKNGL